MLHGMWDLPRPGLEPVSLALAGRFLTTAPPGKPLSELSELNIHALDIFSIVFFLIVINFILTHIFSQNSF